MLQKLDAVHLHRLRVADELAAMDPSDFDMRSTSRCICGHALRIHGKWMGFPLGWQSQLRAGAALLGISTAQALELFAPANRSSPDDGYTTPQEAARVVRYLAATDTVDWSVAGKPDEPANPTTELNHSSTCVPLELETVA